MSNSEKSGGAEGRRWYYPSTWTPRTALLVLFGLTASNIFLKAWRHYEDRQFRKEETAMWDEFLGYVSEGKQIRETLESKLEKQPATVGNHEESKSRWSLRRHNRE